MSEEVEATEIVIEEPLQVHEEPVYCRHCGVQASGVDGDTDWLCPGCGQFQDSMTCPTCKSVTRISLMPAEYVPEPHKPKKEK
jgi:predicted RNA-binding Zn-ribbon protein involved in translation (DUF1610 family)